MDLTEREKQWRVKAEVALGKAYFPKFNTIRIWLCCEEFRLNEDTFAAKFETYLRICGCFGLSAIPVLLNRWYDEAQEIAFGDYSCIIAKNSRQICIAATST